MAFYELILKHYFASTDAASQGFGRGLGPGDTADHGVAAIATA